MRIIGLALALVGALGACAPAPEPIDVATRAAMEEVSWADASPPSLTLVTMVNNRSNSAAHSALIVNASERVIFDPAGTWYHPNLPEVGDVHYGISPGVYDFFVDYYARSTYRMVRHEIEVSPEVAERALVAVQNYGAVPHALCSNAISDVIATLPGFEPVGRTIFPGPLMRRFSQLPGVTETVTEDDDPDNKNYVVERYAAQGRL